MLRAAGCLLIALGALLTRQEVLRAPKEEIGTLRALSLSLRRLEKEIALTLFPLPLLLQKDGLPFFISVREALQEGNSLCQSWSDAAQKLPLSQESRESLASLAPLLDGEEACVRAALLSTAETLSSQAEQCAASLRERGRIVNVFTFSTAALVSILLL